MQVAIDNTSALGRKLNITVPAEEVQTQLDAKYQDAAKNTPFKGFRKGKTPVEVIKQKLGDELHKQVVGSIIESSLDNALRQHDLAPVADPEVSDLVAELGKDLQYVATFEIFPDLADIQYKKLKLVQKTGEISQDDLDKAMAQLLNRFADFEAAEEGKAAADGDSVIVDFVGTLADGTAFEGGSGSDMQVIIGSKNFIDGFESGLIGAKVGDVRDLKLKFPENYQAAQLAGKDVNFNLTVKKIEIKKSAELTSDMAIKMGFEDGDVTKVEKFVRNDLERQLKQLLQQQNSQKSFAALQEMNKLEDIPEVLLQREIEVLQAESRQKAGVEVEPNDPTLLAEAKKRVTLSIMLRSIIKKENIQPDQAKVQKRFQEMTAYFGNKQPISDSYKEQLLYEVQNNILVDQVAELIIAEAEIKEENTTYEELLKNE